MCQITYSDTSEEKKDQICGQGSEPSRLEINEFDLNGSHIFGSCVITIRCIFEEDI